MLHVQPQVMITLLLVVILRGRAKTTNLHADDLTWQWKKQTPLSNCISY